MSYRFVNHLRILCALMLCFAAMVLNAEAAKLTSAQRKELSSIKKNLGKTSLLIRKKKYEEATKAIDAEEERLLKLAKDAMISETDPILVSSKKLINLRRALIEKGMGGGTKKTSQALSFETHIAPIINDKCVNCHNAQRASANLKLDTYAGMKQGGRSGVLLVPGNPNSSLIIRKLVAPDNQRMPRNGEALKRDQIQLIARWIVDGARFDGDKETDPIGASLKNKKNPVTVVKATGNEKVSFMDDIAPWMLNFCLRCHSGNNPASEFSIVTFEDILRGGESGSVIVPGKPDDSRLWHLVGLQDPIKMPQGQALIKRKQAQDLKTWIAEGAKFDGKDAKAALRSMVPTDDEKRMAELATLSPEKFADLRRESAESIWKRALTKEKAEILETDDFIFYGNVSASRLKQISKWAETQADELRKLFNEKQKPLWKGKLAVFVYKDRFGYSEFNQTIEDRRADRSVSWHSKVTPLYLDAYLVLEDVGDEASADSPDLQTNVIAGLTNAAIQRGAGDVPMWVTSGLGLLLASNGSTSQTYFESLRTKALEAAPKVTRPEELFAEGTFSPSETSAIGMTLVEFLIKSGGVPKMAQLLKELKSGTAIPAALTKVYGSNLRTLAGAYARTLRPGRVNK